MELQDFKRRVKELALGYGLRKSEVSIKADHWLRIRTINCLEFTRFERAVEELAQYVNNSDVCTDYFEHHTGVKNKYGTTFSGLIITNYKE